MKIDGLTRKERRKNERFHKKINYQISVKFPKTEFNSIMYNYLGGYLPNEFNEYKNQFPDEVKYYKSITKKYNS